MRKAFSFFALFCLFFSSLMGCQNAHVQTKVNGISGAYKETVLANGVGRSINAITGNYAEVTSQYKNVFDSTSLHRLTITKTSLRHQEASSYISSSAKNFSSSLSADYSVDRDFDSTLPLFTTDLSSRYHLDASFDYTSETRQLYYTFSQNILANLLEIDGYQDLPMLQNALGSDFQDDALKIENGSLTPAEFLSRYGTHVVLAAYFGGKIRCDYYLAANNTSVDTSSYFSYKTTINGLLSHIIAKKDSLSSSLDIAAGLKFSKQNQTETFNAKAWGGKNIPMATESEFSTNFSKWVDSFNDVEDYTTLIDFPSNSLISVWKLLPSKYTKAKQALKNEFEAEASKTYDNYLSRYTIPEDQYVSDTKTIAPLNCAKDNGYDSSIPDSGTVEKNEIDPNIVKFEFLDVAITKDGKYKQGFVNFGINLITLQDTSKIKLTHCKDSKATAAELSKDDYSIKKIRGISTSDQPDAQVGYGSCFICVAFADESKPYLKSILNILDDVHQSNVEIPILRQEDDENMQNKKIKNITLVFVYEINVSWPGMLGITNHTFTNWRVEASLDFC